MKIFKFIGIALFCLLVLNILSWAIWGQQQTLILAAEDFDAYGALDGKDTLHIYAKYPEDNAYWTDPAYFSSEVREKLFNSLIRKEVASKIQFYNYRLESLPDTLSPDNFIFGAGVRSNVPLYAEVVAMVYTPGFFSDREREWFWFFGWWPLGYGTYGVS